MVRYSQWKRAKRGPVGVDLACRGVQRVYESMFCGRPVIVKERFSKKYRHPILDDKLTKRRLASVREPVARVDPPLSRGPPCVLPVQEARCLVRCRKAGIRAPCPVFVDEVHSRIVMEAVPGVTARAFINTPSNAHRELCIIFQMRVDVCAGRGGMRFVRFRTRWVIWLSMSLLVRDAGIRARHR